MSVGGAAGEGEASPSPAADFDDPELPVLRRSYRRLRHAHAVAAAQIALTTAAFVFGWYRWQAWWPPSLIVGLVALLAIGLAALGYAAADRARHLGRVGMMLSGFVLSVAIAAVTLLPLAADLTAWGFWPLFWLPSAALLLTLSVATGRCADVELRITPPTPEELAQAQAQLDALREKLRAEERECERRRLENPALAAEADARYEAEEAAATLRMQRRMRRARRWWPYLRHVTATAAVILSGVLGGFGWQVSVHRHVAVRYGALGLLALTALWLLAWSYSPRPQRRKVAAVTAMVIQFCLGVFTLMGSLPVLLVSSASHAHRVYGGLFVVIGLTWLMLAVGCYHSANMEDLLVHDPEAQAD